jgi:excisionase family DNA binding protein
MLERLLTPGDVADRCQVSTKTVLRAIHRGRLRASRLGEQGAYRIREADAESWIEACVLEAAAPARAAAPPAPPSEESPPNGRLVLKPDMGRF